MKKHQVVLLLISIPTVIMLTGANTKPKESHNEAWYVDKLQEQVGGKKEVRCPYGRADLATSNLVIEVDFLDKFKEGIGQSLWYSWHGGKKP